jgi:flagellar assembly factor FliW
MSEPTEPATDADQHVLTFPDGIPGFPDAERFMLVELVEDGAFQQLQSLDDPDVSLIVCVPWLFFPDYAPVLSDAEQEQLGIETQEDAIVFCPVSLEPATNEVFLNLLGPFVVNSRTRIGRQLVLAGSDYEARTPVELTVA